VTGVRTAHTADLDATTLAAARELLYEVFDDMTEDDWSHCVGGMHALAFDGDELVGHGAVVQRRLMNGGRTLRTGYVEGVAVRAGQRRRGHGGAIMAELERVVRGGYELGALAGTDEASALYSARGWLPWRGPTFAMTPEGVVRTEGEDDSIYVYPLDAPLDPTAALTCDWREGELW
jgi:aminoglycoside 2'-N-acetyltransferase I